MDLSEIREKFATSASEYTDHRHIDNNSFGAFILADNTYFEVGKWVCHGWLSEYNMQHYIVGREKLKKGVKYALSAVMKPWVSEDKLLRYIDWLINRSPWEKIFVDKDATSVRQLGYLVDANHPSSFIGSAMVASRFMTESYSGKSWECRCKVYQELLEIGCTENEAFFFAHMYNIEVDKGLYPLVFSRLQSGHWTFFGSNYQENYVRNFLTGHVAKTGANILASGKGYESDTLNSTWGLTDLSSDAFGKKVQALQPIRMEVKKDHHIFRKLRVDSYSIQDRADFISIINQLKGLLNA